MDSRLQIAKRFEDAGKVPIVIPGVPPFKGPITPGVIEAKGGVQKKHADNADSD